MEWRLFLTFAWGLRFESHDIGPAAVYNRMLANPVELLVRTRLALVGMVGAHAK